MRFKAASFYDPTFAQLAQKGAAAYLLDWPCLNTFNAYLRNCFGVTQFRSNAFGLIQLRSQRLTLCGTEIVLSKTQRLIMQTLLDAPKAEISSLHFLSLLGYSTEAESHTIQTHIHRIRTMLDRVIAGARCPEKGLIQTGRAGYRLAP